MTATPSPQQNVSFFAKWMIESVFKDGIRGVAGLKISKNKTISGRFKEKASRGEVYQFVITPSGVVEYNEAINRETSFLRSDSGISFYYSDSNKKPNCFKGKRCKGSCIKKGKKCIVQLPTKARRQLHNFQKAIKFAQEGKWLLSSAQTKGNALSAEEVNKKVEEFENRIKDEPFENLIIIDSKTGESLYETTDNDPGQVSLNPSFYPLLKDSTVTHNHPVPEGYPRDFKGVSFSDADIRAAATHRAKEVRAVTQGYRHSMKPPETGWNAYFWELKVKPSYIQNSQKVIKELRWKFLLGLIDRFDAQAEFHHKVWENVAKETGMKYSREEIKKR